MARNPHIGFIHSPGPVRTPQFAPNLLIQNGRITLHLAPDGHVVNRRSTFRHDFFQISVAP